MKMHMTDGHIICHAQTTLFSNIWGHQVHFAISDLTEFHSLSHAVDRGPFFKLNQLTKWINYAFCGKVL